MAGFVNQGIWSIADLVDMEGFCKELPDLNWLRVRSLYNGILTIWKSLLKE